MQDATATKAGPDRRDPDSLPENDPADPAARGRYRLVCLAGLLLGVWVCWSALKLTYYTPIGPGPGFFPFWLVLLLAGFSAAILARSFLQRPTATAERFVPSRSPLVQIVATIAAIAGFAFFVEELGFAITMFLVLTVLLLVRGCRLFPTTLLVALGGSFGVGFAFTRWLEVYVPPAPFGLLRFLGL